MADEQSPGMEHDALVRRVLGDPDAARAWLKDRLPEDTARHVDFDTLQLQPGTFVDEELRRAETDVLFVARHDSGQPVFVYLLVEHQSTVDFWLRLRLLRYQGRIWERERARRPGVLALSPIVTVVLHHGPREWSPPTRFEDLYNEAVRALPGVCRFGHVLVELHRMRLEDARGDAYGRAMEMLLSDHHRTQADRLRQLLPPLFPEIRDTPDGPRKVVTLLRYYRIEYGGAMSADLTAAVEEHQTRHGRIGLTPEDLTMLDVLEATLRREGREEGREEGRREGREEGRIVMQIALVERMLAQGVSWETVEELAGIDQDGLHQLRKELAVLQGNTTAHDR